MTMETENQADATNEVHRGLLFMTAMTSIHAGSGGGFSLVDLKIQREQTTNYPFIQSTGLKGVMRDIARRHWSKKDDDSDILDVFGSSISPDTTNPKAGRLSISDGRILFLPVRSLAGIFAYVTSPQVLWRLKRDAKQFAAIELPELKDTLKPSSSSQEECFYYNTTSGDGSGSSLLATDSQVIIEDLLLTPKKNDDLKGWVEKLFEWVGEDAYEFPKRFLLVHDDVFSYLCEVAMTIHNRTRLKTDGSKQVVSGGLFNQEFLPEFTALYGIISRDPDLNADLVGKIKNLCGQVWQVGANESTGKGFMKPCLIGF